MDECMEEKKIRIFYRLNGKDIETFVPPKKRLIDHLREDMKQLSAKEGCGQGECGACTIIMDGRTLCSCLMTVGQAIGKNITTLEGLGTKDKPHPIQEAFLKAGAVQCGFCTPGMILSVKVLLDNNQNPTEEEIKEAISGNLCRCTGYGKIMKAVKLAGRELYGGGE